MADIQTLTAQVANVIRETILEPGFTAFEPQIRLATAIAEFFKTTLQTLEDNLASTTEELRTREIQVRDLRELVSTTLQKAQAIVDLHGKLLTAVDAIIASGEFTGVQAQQIRNHLAQALILRGSTAGQVTIP